MTRIFVLLLLSTLPAGAFAAAAAAPAAAPAGKSMTEDDKVIFAVGEILSSSVKPFAFSEHEMQLVREGFDAGMHGKKTGIDAESYRAKIQTMLTERLKKSIAAAKTAGQAYRSKAAAETGATTTASGIVMTTMQAGSGPSPTPDDQVKVQYEGRMIDGSVFDSSKQHGGQPASFKVSGVVPCWTEALQHMSVGTKLKLVCPPELAYGDRGAPPQIPGGATLVFDVELLAIDKAPAPAAAAPTTPATPASPTQPAAPATPQ
jgi:FKBP-type peptidyl-prolyl cis-trans isomerase FkpA